LKRIISGTRYDTTKAECIGQTSAACSRSDFRWWTASLYVTPRSRRYFLAGRGGPCSMFSVRVEQNSWSGGDGIIPLTKDEAFAWAQRELTTDEVEAAFDDMIEDA